MENVVPHLHKINLDTDSLTREVTLSPLTSNQGFYIIFVCSIRERKNYTCSFRIENKFSETVSGLIIVSFKTKLQNIYCTCTSINKNTDEKKSVHVYD